MKLTTNKIELLRKFVNHTCEQCNKKEAVVGFLEPHKIFPRVGYVLRNIKMVCPKCHDYYSSADRKARGIQ